MIVKDDRILAVCLLAGKMMIESGSEMYRVEDTMQRIAYNAGAADCETFTTPTGLLMSLGESRVQILQVTHRTINLEQVERINALSRRFAVHDITLADFHRALIKLNRDAVVFPAWLQLIAAAVISSTLMILYNGVWFDFPSTALIGTIGYAIFYFGKQRWQVNFLNEFFASLAIGLLAWAAVRLHLGQRLDLIIIGAVMPLVPGVPITNAVRDILAGHLLSGLARGLEALLSVSAIGIGIALTFRLF